MELFWSLTPKEFHFCYKAWQDTRDDDYKTGWEQTRMVVFYQYLTIPKKGRNPSFQKFKLDHLPFPWDRVSRHVDEDLMVEEPQGLTPQDWLERISKMHMVKPLKEVGSIK